MDPEPSPPKRGSTVSVVIPCYRSAASLPLLVERLAAVLGGLAGGFEIILVDDCSPDGTWEVLKGLKQAHGSRLKIARLLRNSGQHNAILCGFNLVAGDVAVTMDDDLQNPPEEIPKLLAAVEAGYDLAVGAYDSKKHSGPRNLFGGLVDALQRRMFGLPASFQLTSFRAVRRVVVERVNQMAGVFPYITSMLLSHSATYTNVAVHHEARPYGRSNYNLKRSLTLAGNLLLSYSPYPVYLVAALSLAAFLFALGLAGYVLYLALFVGTGVPGWASLVVILAFFNAMILLCMLIFALYLSRFNQQLTRTRIGYTVSELHE